MLISYNSQLGLRFKSKEVKAEYCQSRMKTIEKTISTLNSLKDKVSSVKEDDFIDSERFYINDNITLSENEKYFINIDEDNFVSFPKENYTLSKMVDDVCKIETMVMDDGGKYFYICESVYKAAELIKINKTFTGRTLKDINFGKYTYLMGKYKMIRFVCSIGVIAGIYYDSQKEVAFNWGIDIESGEYVFDKPFHKEFSQIIQILTFIELGDIEVVQLLAGRTNNLPKKSQEKISNTSNNTIYVVDSSWNKLIIRTDGFAVRGHFRLQPCGVNMADRKLIWINAFEKHGFTRRPKAQIIHNN